LRTRAFPGSRARRRARRRPHRGSDRTLRRRRDVSEAQHVAFRIHRDHLYVAAEDFNAHMAGWRTAALLRRGDDLCVASLTGAEAGGYLIKQINARGDRAIHAADFLRLNGLDAAREIACRGAWRAEAGAFVLAGLFARA